MQEEDPSGRPGGLSQTLGKSKTLKIRRRGLEDTSALQARSVPTEFYQKNRLAQKTPPNAPWFGSIAHKDEILDNFMLPPSPPELQNNFMDEFVGGRSLNNAPHSALLSASLPVNFGTNELPNFSNLNLNITTIKNQNTDGSDTASMNNDSFDFQDINNTSNMSRQPPRHIRFAKKVVSSESTQIPSMHPTRSSLHSGKQEDVEPPTVSSSFTCFELLQNEQRGTTKAEAFTHDFTTENNNITNTTFLPEEDEFEDEEDLGIFTLETN